MIRNVYLYGYLGEEYGKEHKLEVESIGEAMRAFAANYGSKFLEDVHKGSFHVLRGENLKEAEEFTEEEQLVMNFEKGDFHIVPVIEGAKSAWTSVFIGAVMVAVGVYTMYQFPGNPWSPYLIMGGIGMMMGGVAVMLTPVPDMTLGPGYQDREDQKTSFIYTGPLNTVEQGGAVPLVYGRAIIGSTVISAEMDIEDTN